MTGGRILVVDDDALLRSSVAAVLADEGYEVDLAGDGVDALAKIHANPPDVILLDLLMPRMNGKALLETLHASAATSGISVLVMTALHGFESHRTLKLGAKDLVEKPFDIDELLNKVALAVYRARNEREASTAGEQTASRGVVLVVGDAQRGIERVDRMATALGYTAVSLMHVTHELPRLARLLDPRAIVLSHSPDSTTQLEALELLRAEPALDATPILVLGPDADDHQLAEVLG
ncbi:MAG TPA: response regulator [Kofleriaceae bacterium]|nr:response regulator [Kofleriaceae bacterium]